MPIVYPSYPLVDGDPMRWVSELAADFTAARDWVNAVPLADITARSIRREHLVRPAVFGFPYNGVRSDFQKLFWRSFGEVEATALQPSEWGARRNRIVLVPYATDAEDGKELWRTPISATVHARGNWFLDVQCTFEVQIRNSDAVARYPSGSGGGPAGLGARAGHFKFHLFNRQTGDNNEYDESIQHVYPLEQGSLHHDMIHLSMTASLSQGHYDLSVVYHRGGAPDGIDQIDISRAYLLGRMT